MQRQLFKLLAYCVMNEGYFAGVAFATTFHCCETVSSGRRQPADFDLATATANLKLSFFFLVLFILYFFLAALIVTLAKVQEPLGEGPADFKLSFSILFFHSAFRVLSYFLTWTQCLFVWTHCL